MQENVFFSTGGADDLLSAKVEELELHMEQTNNTNPALFFEMVV